MISEIREDAEGEYYHLATLWKINLSGGKTL
jgi:hypothetical protein